MDIITNECIEIGTKKQEDNFSANVISSVKASAPEKPAEIDVDCEKLLKFTTMSIRMLTNSYYKSTPFIEAGDIEHIKESLNNYANKDDKLAEFKNAIINDLSDFQKQIKAHHVEKLTALMKEQQLCERQIQVLTTAKNQLVRERLAKVEWPYDAKTKAYDSKIAALQITNQKHLQKIEDMRRSKPLASEKDIILYQMQLKEKFSR